MTFLNSAGLLNMGAAETVKTATGNAPSQEFQANQSDEFAQALRKQMQQANKPATPVVPAADSKSQPVKEALRAQSSQPSHNTVNNESASKEQPKPAASGSEEKNTQEARGDQANTTEDKTSTAEENPAVNETSQDRKKRLLANLETQDPAAAGLTPWMQTMMAMRPNAQGQQIAQDKGGVSREGTEVSLQGDDLLIDPSTMTVPGEDVAGKASAGNLAAQVRPEMKPTGAAVDSKLPVAEDAKGGLAEKPADFPETLGIAKAVADAVRETVATDKATAQVGHFDSQPENATAFTLPAAQVLPNSPWLNAAGVAQTANVFMSQVATPFGNERWQTAMNQHVLNMVGSGDDVASLTLSPPDLGPIQVVLKVDNQSVNTSFITDNPLVRQALEDGLQDLRARMQSQGLELGHTFVGNGQQAQQHFEQQSSGNTGKGSGNSAEAEGPTVTQATVKTTVSRGLVDTFV